jgi:hypothetical protein
MIRAKLVCRDLRMVSEAAWPVQRVARLYGQVTGTPRTRRGLFSPNPLTALLVYPKLGTGRGLLAASGRRMTVGKGVCRWHGVNRRFLACSRPLSAAVSPEPERWRSPATLRSRARLCCRNDSHVFCFILESCQYRRWLAAAWFIRTLQRAVIRRALPVYVPSPSLAAAIPAPMP